jgi:hypothetical protein
MNTYFKNKHFVNIPCSDGILADMSGDQHPTKVYGWGYSSANPFEIQDKCTHFGFVVNGISTLTIKCFGVQKTFSLSSGMYFSVYGDIHIHGGCGFISSRLGYHGVFMIGGPIEDKGRLLYIDGCSDSLLIPPVIKGDPCLNFLHFPSNINQTRHTHPSLRVGVVAGGRGRCVVPKNDDGSGSDIEIPLLPGHIFIIPTDGHHSFFTDDSSMDVIAYHPDSDTGPTHNDHPMINRTIVGGVSAAYIDEIRTVKIN